MGVIQGHTGTCGEYGGHTGTYGDMQAHTGTCRHMRGHAGTCGDMQAHTEICRDIRGHAKTYGHMQRHTGTYRETAFTYKLLIWCGDKYVRKRALPAALSQYELQRRLHHYLYAHYDERNC